MSRHFKHKNRRRCIETIRQNIEDIRQSTESRCLSPEDRRQSIENSHQILDPLKPLEGGIRMEKLIADLLQASDLLEARDCLELIKRKLNKPGVDRQAFCKELAQALRDQVLHDQALQDQALRDQALQNQALQDQALRDQALQNQALQDRALRDQVLQGQALQDQVLRDRVLQDGVLLDQALHEQALRDRALQDQALLDQVMRDQVLQNQVLRDQAAKGINSAYPRDGVTPRYRIYPAEKSIPLFLVLSGIASGKVGVTRQKIRDLILDVDETISVSRGRVLTVDKEEDIFILLAEKFSFWKTVHLQEPVTVLNINNSHLYYNSICGTDEGDAAYIIYMFAAQNDAVAPEYAFLHELGHILQTTLTGSANVVPEEFMEMHYSIPHAAFLDQDSESAANFFADTFAAAAMHGTALARFDPLGFPDRLMDTWEAFYLELFAKNRR